MEIFIIILLLVAIIITTLALGVRTVPQGEEWVIERLGKFSRTLKPGLNFIIPYLEYIKARVPTKDIIIDIDPQEAITKDNAIISVDTIAFIKITSPEKAIYGVENYRTAIEQLIITTIRSIIGDMTLDEALSNREKIKLGLAQTIAGDIKDWGVTIRSVDIQGIIPSESMKKAMEQLASAEREKKAIETLAEAHKKQYILEAEGRLRASELEAKAQVALAEASAKSMHLINQGLQNKELPAMFLLGDRYINTLEKMATSENAKFVVYPADIQASIKGILGNIFNK
jgi:regulator of protease activity HflC (stomatin/prohibitin superfamily)